MIVYRCADLMFATKIQSTADALQVPARPVRSMDMLHKRLQQIDDGKPCEPVTCLMLDLETGEDGLAMLDAVKQHDAGIRIIAFGSHVQFEVLAAAKDRGADDVMPRSQFTTTLPELIQTYGVSAV